MAIDVTKLVNSLGINLSSTGQNRPTDYSTNQGGKAAKPAGFASNVAHSVGDIVGNVTKGLVGGAAKSFLDTAKGITQGLPGIGSIAQNQKYVDHSLKQITAAQESYTRAHSEGRISNERYKALLRDLGKQYDEISGQSKKNAETVSATDFAAGLGTVATLPLAAGRLTNAGRLGAIAAKIPQSTGMAASATSRSLPAAAAIAPLKAVGYASSASSLAQIPGQIERKDYAGAAGNAALLASPLAIAGGAKVLPKIGKAASEAVYGRQGILDKVFTPQALKAHLEANPGDLAKLKQQELFTLNQPAVKSGRISADQFLKEHYASIGVDPQKVGVKQAIADFQTYAQNVTKLEKKYPNLVVTHDFRTALPKAIKAINKAGGNQLPAAERVTIVGKALDDAGISNPTVKRLMSEAIINADHNVTNADLRPLVQKLIVPTKGVKLGKGFVATLAPTTGKAALPTIEDAAKAGGLTFGKDALPGVGAIGRGLEKVGLSTQGQSPEVYAKYRGFLSEELGKLGLDPKQVQSSLESYTHGASGFGVLDERQLGKYSLKQALAGAGVETQAQAKQVQKAIIKAYSRMTFGDLGAAGKLENALYKVPGYGIYRRIQGVGRYQGNPFFRVQQNVEAELLSQAATRVDKSVNIPGTNYLRSIFGSARQDELQGFGKQVAKDYLGEGASGAGAQNNSLGVITAKLTRTQEISLGGLVESMAKNSGKSVDEFLKTADPQALDTIRKVVQYPRQGFTSSNFAKAMNTLIFPSRYSIKLAGIAGKTLSEMPPALQIGTLKGLSDFSNFLNSDAGIKWQSDNSEVLGVVNYLNPFNNITKILQGLKNNDLQLSDFGMIGGLPLGVITQMLKSQGIVNTSSPYLNPKTGEVVPDQLPADTAGAVKLLLADVVNQMYSFPGRTFGTPISKKDITQSIPGLKPGKGETSPAPTGKLSPYQQRTQQVLSQAKSAGTTPSAPKIRKETQYNLNALAGVPRNTSLPGPAAKKAKKAKPKAFRPRPL